MKKKVRNCPECNHWWFTRTTYGCSLDENRQTNTTDNLGSEWAAGPCKDFKPIKRRKANGTK